MASSLLSRLRQMHNIREFLEHFRNLSISLIRFWEQKPRTKKPIEKYQWCLRNLRRVFKLTSQDIFDKNHRYGLAYYIVVFLWLFTCSCLISTIIDSQHYDFSTRFICLGLLVGGIQVRQYEY